MKAGLRLVCEMLLVTTIVVGTSFISIRTGAKLQVSWSLSGGVQEVSVVNGITAPIRLGHTYWITANKDNWLRLLVSDLVSDPVEIH